MKKNYLFGFFAMASMLFTTSCQQDNLVPAEADTDLVTFAINTQDVATRATTGEGSLADNLYYGVYEFVDTNGDGTKEWRLIEEANVAEGEKQGISMTKTPHSSFTAENGGLVTLRLAKQKEYSIIFWAEEGAEGDGLCDVDWDTRQLSVNPSVSANAESYDAFWAHYHIVSFSGAQKKEITLTRPFAQVNIGVKNEDLEAAKLASVDLKESAITVKKVPTTMSLVDGTVSGLTETSAVAYASAAIPTTDWTFPVSGNTYLALNYVLVGTEPSLVNIDLEYTDTEGGKYSYAFTNIPVQRNYRTNIYGNILTASEDYEVDIEPGFDGNVTDGETIFDIPGLQAAIDAAPAGKTTTIYLGSDLEGDVTIVQKPGVKITVDGEGKKFNGSIKVHSNSNHYADAALTVKNVNFESSVASINFIEALEKGSERYSTNITVENCTFTATGEAVKRAVGVQIKASKWAKVIDCTATDLHSLIQAQSCDETVLVQNCTVNGKNGVAFKQVKAATVEGTTIAANEYGIRFDGNTDNYGIKVKDNNVSAVKPFIVRKMTGKNNTITLEGENTLTATGTDQYQIVITNGSDDAEYVKPTGTYTLSGADNYLVYPRDLLVASWDEFTAALAANKPKIKLTEDITYDANYQLQKDVVIDLNGKSMTLPMINIHNKVTIKNGTINGKVYARNKSNITFENIKFSGAISDNLSTEGHLAIQGGCTTLYAKDCLFSPTSVSGSQTKPLSFEGGSTIMKFENCEFKSSPYKKQVYFNSLSATGSLDFTNCNFNNKTPNIMFAAACPLTNLTMSGTTMLSSVTLETNRAKEAVTAEDLAYLRESLIANNSMSSVRLFYTGGSSEYIR